MQAAGVGCSEERSTPFFCRCTICLCRHSMDCGRQSPEGIGPPQLFRRYSLWVVTMVLAAVACGSCSSSSFCAAAAAPALAIAVAAVTAAATTITAAAEQIGRYTSLCTIAGNGSPTVETSTVGLFQKIAFLNFNSQSKSQKNFDFQIFSAII